MDLPAYRRTLGIGEQCDLVLPTFGVHPWNAPEYAGRLDELGEAIESSPMLGEIGLDFHFVKETAHYPAQRQVFEFFLAAARDQGKVVNLHTKGAESEALGLLDHYEIQQAIVHWYSGPLDILGELVARGVYLTVGVEVLHSEHIRTIARAVPLEQLLTETDNPGGPRLFTGALGMPGAIRDVVQAVAELRALSAHAIIEIVHANLARLVGDDVPLPRMAA
jgi:TatD DNase family protein